MNTKIIVIIFIVVVLMLLGVWYWYATKAPSTTTTTYTTTQQQNTQSATNGTVKTSSDSTADIATDLNNVSNDAAIDDSVKLIDNSVSKF